MNITIKNTTMTSFRLSFGIVLGVLSGVILALTALTAALSIAGGLMLALKLTAEKLIASDANVVILFTIIVITFIGLVLIFRDGKHKNKKEKAAEEL